MLRSMTGYGTGTATIARYTARVEIRSVNHRYLDVVIHLPRGYAAYEDSLRGLVKEKLARGRVEIFVNLEEFGSRERSVTVDEPLLQAYSKAFNKCGSYFGELHVTADALLAIPDLFTVEEAPSDAETIAEVFQRATNDALAGLVSMRETEGQRLEEDILGRMAAMRSWLQNIEKRQPFVVHEYREKLKSRIAELLEKTPVDEGRLAMEIALFADKVSIAEECVRGFGHITHFKDACQTDGSVGRKLDFLLQELHREINTLAVKSADNTISETAVNMKAELEKVREQVQNIE